jgi:hypothetical protein
MGGLAGAGFAFGGLAMGWQAWGGLALAGAMACGGFAAAWQAAYAGMALARDYAVGGAAWARHANDAPRKPSCLPTWASKLSTDMWPTPRGLRLQWYWACFSCAARCGRFCTVWNQDAEAE